MITKWILMPFLVSLFTMPNQPIITPEISHNALNLTPPTIEERIDKKIIEWDMMAKKLLVYEIIRRESTFIEDICNEKYGCTAGAGLMGVIPSTNQYCEKKLNKELNPKIAEDNLDCGLWLLKNEGIKHWEEWSGTYKDYL